MDSSLLDLQTTVQDSATLKNLGDYFQLTKFFLEFIDNHQPTRIVSPTQKHMFFINMGKLMAIKLPGR